MGRIAFYHLQDDRDIVLFDSQPELIRGISHSADGNFIYVSIGDVSCQKLQASDLKVVDNVIIVEEADPQAHKPNCERAFTFIHQHKNVVLTIQMPLKGD